MGPQILAKSQRKSPQAKFRGRVDRGGGVGGLPRERGDKDHVATAAFDHPVQKREWYWDEDFDTYWDRLQLSDAVTVEYMTNLFLAPDQLKRYSLEQVAQGIWFLIGESSPGKSAYALLNAEVPLDERVDCIRAVANFFRIFVVPLAPSRANEQNDHFQEACFM